MSKLFILACFTLALYGAKVPSWFESNMPKGEHELIGMGSGVTINDAKAAARRDIASQVRVKVSGSSHFAYDSTGKREGSIRINEEVSSELEGASTLKSEEIDGVWYVAMVYDVRPVNVRIMAKKTILCAQGNTSHSTPLMQTPFIESIDSSLGCQPQWQLSRDGDLEKWLLVAGEETFNVKPSLFFYSHSSPELSLQSSRYELKNNQSFQLFIKSSRAGYVSLFVIDSLGQVAFLESLYLKSSGQISYPSNDKELISQIESGVSTQDMYVAIYSEKPLAHDFYKVGNTLIKNEARQGFNRFLASIGGYIHSSVIVTTSK